MKHIVVVGDSFNDVNKKSETYPYNEFQKFDLNDLLTGGTLKLPTLISLDIFNQKLSQEITVHILGKGSAGNHYISEALFRKVNEIRSNYQDDEIFAIIQLTALFRNDENMSKNITEIEVEKYKYDYYDLGGNLDYKVLKENYHKQLDNIENIDLFCKKNKVTSLIFFGWATIFNSDVQTFKLDDRIEKIKEIVTFFPYDKNLDEMENYCSGYKFSKKIGDNKNLYEVGPNYFGGMTDYIRTFVEIGERYIMSYDPHLTSKSNVIFYDKIIKPWLISKNLLVDKSLDDKVLEKIKFIFDLEKIKYDVFYESKREDFPKIRELTRHLLYSNIFDLKMIEDNFKSFMIELENNYIYNKTI